MWCVLVIAGFMSTMDTNARGNYGLMDILHSLEWVHRYIAIFDGDPGMVTLVGIGSGAAAVSLLMLSPHAYTGASTYSQSLTFTYDATLPLFTGILFLSQILILYKSEHIRQFYSLKNTFLGP